MKKFIINCILVFVFIFFSGEIIVRTFGLYEKPILRESKGGNYLPVPYQKGTMVRGKFKEVNGKYSINNLGYNSIHNYYPEKITNKFKIAIIGDSYVEGVHVDTNNGIGAILEKQLGEDFIVYEYGVSETNIADYENIYKQYDLETFDLVFVIFSIADLYGFNPDSIGTEDKGKGLKNSFFRKIYNQSHFIPYLNFNHAIVRGIKDKFRKQSIEDLVKATPELNTQFLDNQPENLIAVYNKVYEDEQIDELVNFDYLKITHKLHPYTFGFDRHWNENGRKNVTELLYRTVKNYNVQNTTTILVH